MLRLLSRRRCLTCGDELPAPRDYPMHVCAACLLGGDDGDGAPGPSAPTTAPPRAPYPAA